MKSMFVLFGQLFHNWRTGSFVLGLAVGAGVVLFFPLIRTLLTFVLGLVTVLVLAVLIFDLWRYGVGDPAFDFWPRADRTDRTDG